MLLVSYHHYYTNLSVGLVSYAWYGGQQRKTVIQPNDARIMMTMDGDGEPKMPNTSLIMIITLSNPPKAQI
jgi:hypothetical protein